MSVFAVMIEIIQLMTCFMQHIIVVITVKHRVEFDQYTNHRWLREGIRYHLTQF